MLFLIIKYTLTSLILILLFHYLYDFFKNNLTIPKVKDLVDKPASAYNEIYKTLNNQNINMQTPIPFIHMFDKINGKNYQSIFKKIINL